LFFILVRFAMQLIRLDGSGFETSRFLANPDAPTQTRNAQVQEKSDLQGAAVMQI
jgi:hypothetical protein